MRPDFGHTAAARYVLPAAPEGSLSFPPFFYIICTYIHVAHPYLFSQIYPRKQEKAAREFKDKNESHFYNQNMVSSL